MKEPSPHGANRRGFDVAPAVQKPSPLISVVTVTRNSAAHLSGCLDSVAAQAGADFEHWVVDGASTDGTVNLLRERNDPRLHWISEPDSGIYDAMNKAVRLAQGQWMLFLGADDRLRPGVLREVATRLRRPDTVYYGNVWKTGRGKRDAGRFSRVRLALRNICQQGMFYPQSVFDAHAFDLRYAIQADWVLNMACWNDARFRFEYMPILVADYNDESGVSSVRRDLAIERDYVPLLRRYFPPWISLPLALAVHLWRFVSRKEPV